jgi:hypothetical protein
MQGSIEGPFPPKTRTLTKKLNSMKLIECKYKLLE